MKQCPHRVDVDLQHCWECEPKTPVDPNRGTGRTSRMLEALPAGTAPVTVVVDSQAMCDYVRNLARKLRPDLRHPIRVRIVRTPHDCDYLRGCDFVVDHHVWDPGVLNEDTREKLAMLYRIQRR